MEKRIKIDFLYRSLTVRRVRFTVAHFCDGSAGLTNSSFGFAVKGGTVIDCGGRTLDITEGSFFYLPAGVRYRSNWTGAPEIEYYMLHMESGGAEQLYAPARIDALSNAGTLRLIKTAEQGGPDGAAAFYALYSSAQPHLERTEKNISDAADRAAEYIRAHFAENYSAAQLAAACCISESRLYHLFKRDMGVSPLEYRNEIRVERASAMIRDGITDVDRLLRETGFSSDIYFREVFKRTLGLTPTAYRRQMKKM